MKMTVRHIFLSIALSCVLFAVQAQPSQVGTEGLQQPDQQASQDSSALEKQAIEQLRDIQESLSARYKQRQALTREISRASDVQKEDLQADIKELNAEIELLEKTFEQISIGGVDLSVFGVDEEKFDWREELIEVVKPLIENVTIARKCIKFAYFL